MSGIEAPPLNLFKTMDFSPSIDIGPTPPPQLEDLISSLPNLKIYTRASPHFNALKLVWNMNYADAKPLALIRASNRAEVSTVVNFCASNELPLAIRSGGHDLFGRSVVPDAVILDIRELNSIELSEDKKTVTIGGGVQTGDLVNYLDERGLVTSVSLAGIVGHAGWAFGGGFGPFSSAFGLGVDQIVNARVVTTDGKLQEADTELLWGIKGAGGAFGVVTDLDIKVYPLKTMLGGMVLFMFDEAATVIAGLQKMIDKENIPMELCVGFHLSKRGGAPMLAVAFTWASEDLEEGRKWLERIKALGTVMMDMVSETTIKKWSDSMGPMLPPPSHNHSRAFFSSKMTPGAVEVLLSAAKNIPDGVHFGVGNFFITGEAIKPHPESSYNLREPHIFSHALTPTSNPAGMVEAKKWTDGIYEGIKQEGVVKANYVAIMEQGLSVEEFFGEENFERLTVLKRKLDPANVFKFLAADLV